MEDDKPQFEKDAEYVKKRPGMFDSKYRSIYKDKKTGSEAPAATPEWKGNPGSPLDPENRPSTQPDWEEAGRSKKGQDAGELGPRWKDLFK